MVVREVLAAIEMNRPGRKKKEREKKKGRGGNDPLPPRSAVARLGPNKIDG